FYISTASSFTDLVIGGLILGVGGATFSIGVTSLPKYYPKEKHGFINGIYGVGNIGTAITTFGAPIIASSIGWESTVRLFLILLIVLAALIFIFGDKKQANVNNLMSVQLKVLYRNTSLSFLCLFSVTTVGAFVAFPMFLPRFVGGHFGLDPVDAGIRTAIFVFIATLVRSLGGILADKLNS